MDDDRARYAAFKTKDARFDGLFFVGVSSTGIYCRPVCPARLPRPANCTFYDSAAEAEQAGYRPCLLCRPELAPGSAPIDATSALVRKAARLMEEQCASGWTLAGYARRLGCSERHLRRAFRAQFKVTPVRYLQTCRLLLAKNLLTDTRLPVIDVAMASGFGSLRRFNDLFSQQYRMPPTALRKQNAEGRERAAHVSLLLGYRPPYHWEHMLAFLGQRAVPGVETVVDGAYLRVVRVAPEPEILRPQVLDPDTLGLLWPEPRDPRKEKPGRAEPWEATRRTSREAGPPEGCKERFGLLRVAHRADKSALCVTVGPELLPVLPQVLARVRALFDLYCRPDAVEETLAAMNAIRPGLFVPGIRLPGCFEPFEMMVRAVLGQRISVKAAATLAGRIARTLGIPMDVGIPGLTHAFPAAHDLAAMDGDIADRLGPLGVTRARAHTIVALARAVVGGQLDPASGPEAAIRRLTAIPGIGAWTAQYIAMRAMAWPDAFPHSDLGIKKALAPLGEAEILALGEAWRPWRGYATINLWHSLNA